MTEKYYRELARVLKTQDLLTEQAEDNNINIIYNDEIICTINENGSVSYDNKFTDNEDVAEIICDIRSAIYHVKDYTTLVEKAPFLKSNSGNDDFKLLADFGSVILAGKETEIGGYQFATWEKDGSGKGYNYGHYFDSDYTAAKEDFALRANLIDRDKVFSEKEMALLHKCVKSAMEDETLLSFTEEKIAEELCEQIENLYPTIKEQEQEQAIATPNMEQTM